MRFQNKVVIVTGASSGIGAATALLIAKEGGKVVVVGRNETKLKQVEDISAKDGNKVFVINADVSKDEDAKRIIKDTIEEFGKLDVLVNNAGILRFGTILDGKLFDTYDEVFDTNLRGPVNLTILAVPYLIATKGNIVNVSSVAGKSFMGSTTPFYSYNMSKAALDHFTRGAALELGAHGVRVNLVSPGPVKTDIAVNSGMNISMENIPMPKTILSRISESEELAKLIAFVASDDAKGITGSDFVSDNGMLLK